MAEYEIRHETTYDYSNPVLVSQHLTHLIPRNVKRQEWIFHQVQIDPLPTARQERMDLFGNKVLFFSIERNHHHFSALTTGRVIVHPLSVPAQTGPSWEEVAFRMQNPETPEDFEALPYLFFSPFATFEPPVKYYAQESFAPGRSLLESVQDFMGRIFRDFRYAPCTTRVGTSVAEILRERRGVCQDFAHLMVVGLRSFGLPCRYVSGYLLTHSAPGSEKKIGADATHAWVSAYIPPLGWVDLDPTNNLLVSDEHITLAWGRDFGDVSPLKGVIVGGGPHRVRVSVDVKPVYAEMPKNPSKN
jgi:transglutaminase-like putative cysteine protease